MQVFSVKTQLYYLTNWYNSKVTFWVTNTCVFICCKHDGDDSLWENKCQLSSRQPIQEPIQAKYLPQSQCWFVKQQSCVLTDKLAFLGRMSTAVWSVTLQSLTSKQLQLLFNRNVDLYAQKWAFKTNCHLKWQSKYLQTTCRVLQQSSTRQFVQTASRETDVLLCNINFINVRFLWRTLWNTAAMICELLENSNRSDTICVLTFYLFSFKTLSLNHLRTCSFKLHDNWRISSCNEHENVAVES
jgi:hypothetical protein